MELKKVHAIGMSLALVVIAVALIFFMKTPYFFLFIGVGFLAGVSPFVFSIIQENKIGLEKEEMFLEFSRNLVESVKTGTPISKSIINVKNKNYGVLSQHVQKLANQISLGIPLSAALTVFSKDANNKTISRALTLIGQAEKAGGDIGEILEAVAEAVSTADKLKKERKAVISTLVVQGYIIFFVFIIIILVMQFQILPMVSGIAEVGAVTGGTIGGVGGGLGGGETVDQGDISSSFLYLMLIQGFFTGLTIGMLSEGGAKAGIKHSFALMIMSFIVSQVANLLF
jgi:archaeal flagellar protein FlaJ